MSLNRFMHPRSPYFNNTPDFSKLSQKHPNLKNHLDYDEKKKKHTIDFYNPNALKEICCALLKEDFDLEIELPIDHLIPRVPQRVNYCLWIEDLVEKKENCRGIDIGCGSSCIYALILCKLNKNWKMLVSDIDDVNIGYAEKNVSKNEMKNQIEVKKVEKQTLLKGLIGESEEYDFIMTNPPFYKNYYEAQGLESTRKPYERHDPSSINTAQDCECIFDEGGEIGFVKNIIDESVLLGSRIQIYTAMLGKKKSFIELKKYLTDVKKIDNISEAQFCQGHTIRWGLAWTFRQAKLSTFKYMKDLKKKSDNPPIVYEVEEKYFLNNYNAETIYSLIKDLFVNELKVKILREQNMSLLIVAEENTWSNQRRRKRSELHKKAKDANDANDNLLEEKNDNNKRIRGTDSESAETENDNKKKLKTSVDSSYLIKCEIEVKVLDKLVYLKLDYKDGQTKDYVHQLLQFIKNKIQKVTF